MGFEAEEKKTSKIGPRGTQVIKKDLEGNVVHTYTSMHEAQKAERIGYVRLKECIDNGEVLNGHIFFKGREYERTTQETIVGREPWESKRGTFDVDRWGKRFYA